MGTIINDSSLNNFFTTSTGITVNGLTKHYATYADMLADPSPGRFAFVDDARMIDGVGDASIKGINGHTAAFYKREKQSWIKIYETESMDIEIANNPNWENIVGKPDIKYDKLPQTIKQAHEHINFSVIDKFVENTVTNELIWDGKVINNVHVHSNLSSVLEKLNVSDDQKLTFNGNVIESTHEHNNLLLLNQLSDTGSNKLKYKNNNLATESYIESKLAIKADVSALADKADKNALNNKLDKPSVNDSGVLSCTNGTTTWIELPKTSSGIKKIQVKDNAPLKVDIDPSDPSIVTISLNFENDNNQQPGILILTADHKLKTIPLGNGIAVGNNNTISWEQISDCPTGNNA